MSVRSLWFLQSAVFGQLFCTVVQARLNGLASLKRRRREERVSRRVTLQPAGFMAMDYGRID
jgi:hypothetical protein